MAFIDYYCKDKYIKRFQSEFEILDAFIAETGELA